MAQSINDIAREHVHPDRPNFLSAAYLWSWLSDTYGVGAWIMGLELVLSDDWLGSAGGRTQSILTDEAGRHQWYSSRLCSNLFDHLDDLYGPIRAFYRVLVAHESKIDKSLIDFPLSVLLARYIGDDAYRDELVDGILSQRMASLDAIMTMVPANHPRRAVIDVAYDLVWESVRVFSLPPPIVSETTSEDEQGREDPAIIDNNTKMVLCMLCICDRFSQLIACSTGQIVGAHADILPKCDALVSADVADQNLIEIANSCRQNVAEAAA